MFEKLIDNLQFAATSPYALVAYLGLIAAWVYVATNDRRLNRITRVLRDIPESDRLELLKQEYSAAPRAGLGAEQWIRSRKHFLLFLGFLATIAAAVVVALAAITRGAVGAAAPVSPDPRRTAYLSSLRELLVHAEAEFSGIRGSVDAKDTNSWETSFYLQGIPCKMPSVTLDSPTVSYACSILEDADFVEAKRLFHTLLDFTTNTLKEWEFTSESDLSDRNLKEWFVIGISPDESLVVSIDLTQYGLGRESTDLDFTLSATPHRIAFPADHFDRLGTLKYSDSLRELLAHAESSFTGIRGSPYRKQTNSWDSTFLLQGLPCHEARVTTDRRAISYMCTILEDAAYAQAERFFQLMIPVTTNVFNDWRFEMESDLSDSEAMEWRLFGESKDSSIVIDIELTRYGAARRSTDLEMRLTKLPPRSRE